MKGEKGRPKLSFSLSKVRAAARRSPKVAPAAEFTASAAFSDLT
jgi:hypothetical protein